MVRSPKMSFRICIKENPTASREIRDGVLHGRLFEAQSLDWIQLCGALCRIVSEEDSYQR